MKTNTQNNTESKMKTIILGTACVAVVVVFRVQLPTTFDGLAIGLAGVAIIASFVIVSMLWTVRK